MTHEEAIYQLTNFEGTYETPSLETIKLAIKTLEKQIPKKPKKVTLDTYDFTTYYVCPTCNTHDSGCKAPYCRWCGQKLDWNEYE